MESTLQVLNQLEQDGIIGTYAICGAVAATFYIEPVQTYDLDILIILPASTSILVSLAPIFSYLADRGYSAHAETIIIEEWPVQFLPVYSDLTAEALAQAKTVTFAATPTRVLSAEHLAAIMLETGRAKDHARLVAFVEQHVFDQTQLLDILARHNLAERWERFRRRFLEEND